MKIALDVDGCIADFYKATCAIYKQELKTIDVWETPFIEENWDSIAADTEMWRTLEVMNDIDFDFYCYLTSIPKHIIEHRQFWLDSNKLPKKPLLVSYDKVAVADEHGIDILIDDKPANIELWVNSGRIAIQYSPHYSNMPIKSPYWTKDFGQIKTILADIKNKYYEKNSRGVQSLQTRK